MSTPSTATTPPVSRSSSEESFKESYKKLSDPSASIVSVYSAAFTAQLIEHVMGHCVIEDLNPFEIKKKYHLQEWYYCFKKKFMGTFPSGEEFFTHPREEYEKFFSGSQESIRQVSNCMEQCFHMCIKHLLEDKAFFPESMFYTREFIENELIPSTKADDKAAYRMAILARRPKLVMRASQGDYKPLLFHLLALSVSPDDIWDHFLVIFTPKTTTHKQFEELSMLFKEAKSQVEDIDQQIHFWYASIAESHKNWLSKGPGRVKRFEV
ncbi:hypothetical protein EJF18_40132 [Clavispora lusitaniae]|uniref:Uncharacterized protein n=1 Tax=Clavispora lusitaniae TaxID=36911 RepID=A0ACD0WKV8_CLALS|nr:hypothetical protein EJF14_40132 [Clavispora lusitaniae]QFZ33770.1 hypothetical protein EJF16_40132 [Clavispora lusitaniae]QFZ39454.1 hypothetical protein EJF15_40132 [Clavispora lusitaniae]QFZ45136.1 hypothetical protein EJF18_40132 [Clavispora lusitaniae]QFZ50800.1 hypothetical protein EJF17_40132 [Clavispora lusitaniae]